VTPQNSYTDIGYALLMKIQQGTMAYRYRSLPLQKNPFDLALYLRLLDQARPRTLIELGAYRERLRRYSSFSIRGFVLASTSLSRMASSRTCELPTCMLAARCRRSKRF
jgi:hypothetical protein